MRAALALLAISACGGARAGGTAPTWPHGVAYGADARGFVATEPAVVTGEAVTTECAELADCIAQCDGGEAAACVRAGDLVFLDDSLRGEDLWLRACRAHHGGACARLMYATGDDLELSDRYGEHACAYGDASACGMLARARLLRANASRSGDRTRWLQKTVVVLERGCALGDWSSCLVGVALYHKGPLADRAARQRMLGRANALVEMECQAGGPEACAVMARAAEHSGRVAEAVTLYERACAHLMARAAPEFSAEIVDENACRSAERLGGVRARVTAEAMRPSDDDPVWVPIGALRASRTAGEPNLTPPDRVKRHMARTHRTRIDATLVMCISELGTIERLRVAESSGYANYDTVLFDGMRGWRYRPMLVDGLPRRVCTEVRFIYRFVGAH